MMEEVMKKIILSIVVFILFALVLPVQAYDIHGRIVGDLIFAEMPVTLYAPSCGEEIILDTTVTLPDASFIFYDVPEGLLKIQPDSFDYILPMTYMKTKVFEPQYKWVPFFSEMIFYSVE
jgi:hypothetical protein